MDREDRRVASQFIDIHLNIENAEVVDLEISILTLAVSDDFHMRLQEHPEGIAVGSSRETGIILAVVVESLSGCHDALGFLQQTG